MMIHKLDPMAVAGQRNKSRQRDPNVARSSLSFVGLGDDPFGIDYCLNYRYCYSLNLLCPAPNRRGH